MPPASSAIPRRLVGPTPAPSRRLPTDTPIGQIRPVFNDFELADASWDGEDTTLPSLSALDDRAEPQSPRNPSPPSAVPAFTPKRPSSDNQHLATHRSSPAASVASRSQEKDDLYLRRLKGPNHSSNSTPQRRTAVGFITPSKASTSTPSKPIASVSSPPEAMTTPGTTTPRAEAVPLTLPPSVSVRRFTRRRVEQVTTSERTDEAVLDVGSASVEPTTQRTASERVDNVVAGVGATRTVAGGGMTRAERAALAATGGSENTSKLVRKSVDPSFIAALGAKPGNSTAPVPRSSSQRQSLLRKSTSPAKQPSAHKGSIPATMASGSHRATPSRLSQIDMGAVRTTTAPPSVPHDVPSSSFDFAVPSPPRSPRPQVNRSVLPAERYASPALSDTTLLGSAKDWDMSVRSAATASPTMPNAEGDAETVPPKQGKATVAQTAQRRATRRRSVLGQFVDGIFGGAADGREDSNAERPAKRRRSSTLVGRIVDGIFGGAEIAQSAEQSATSSSETSTEPTAAPFSDSRQPPGRSEPAQTKPRLVKDAHTKVSRPVKRVPAPSKSVTMPTSSAPGPLRSGSSSSRPLRPASGPLRPTAASLARAEERQPLAARGPNSIPAASTQQTMAAKRTTGVQPRKRKYEATAAGHSSRVEKTARTVPARSHSSTQSVLARLAQPSRPTSAAEPVKLRDAERARDLELKRRLWERRATEAASAGPSDGGLGGRQTPPPRLSTTPLVDMAERRAMFDRPRATDSRAPPRNRGLELTVPVRGQTPGKASRRRAAERAAFDGRVAAQIAKRDADAAAEARLLDEINAEMIKKERQEKIVWAKPVPEMYRRG